MSGRGSWVPSTYLTLAGLTQSGCYLYPSPPLPSPKLYATHPVTVLRPSTGSPTWARQPKETGTKALDAVLVDGVRGQQLILFL